MFLPRNWITLNKMVINLIQSETCEVKLLFDDKHWCWKKDRMRICEWLGDLNILYYLEQ